MSKYASRKFILTAASALVLLLNGIFEANGLPLLDEQTVLAFVGLVASYVLAQGYADSKK